MTSRLQKITKQNEDILPQKTTQLNANFSMCMKIKHLLIIPLFMFNSLLYNAK